MTQYLINLARFVSYKEKKDIFNNLKKNGYNVSNDSWSYRRIIVDKLIKNKSYIASIIDLKETFYPKTISEIVYKLEKYNIKSIKGKIYREVPFHLKAITDRYNKKNKFKENGNFIYLEAKQENNRTAVRIGIYLDSRETNKIENIKYPDLAIETPYTLGEISDFVRLSKTFKIKVYIITQNDPKCQEAINKFLETNSFDKGNIKIIKSITEIKNNYYLIGFSMWGKNTLKELNNNENNKLLLFGNEKRGLLKSTMDNCKKIIKIGNSSEPLRATQAATFALGHIYKS
jgi:tRNA(Leu) C34 or U34 (ribose-2'-O)-methylase TrmL